MNRGLSFLWVGKLREKANLDFDVFLPSIQKNLQRELVWTIEQKRALIITILRDQKLPNIVVVQNEEKDIIINNREKYKWEVIDGKQRLNAIFDFLDNKFTVIIQGKEFLYSELPIEFQRQIFTYDGYRVDVHYNYKSDPISDQTKIDLFEEINWLGTPQDIEHFNSLKND